MKIRELYDRNSPVFSFEFFPPKTEKGEETLFRTIHDLKSLEPGFVSVTYGAGGTTRDKTIRWVRRIREECGLEAMAHLTCVGSSRDDIKRILDQLAEAGVENILALRGDPPKGQDSFTPVPDGFRYASELVHFIHSNYSFCIGVAGYPETHIESPSPSDDILHLKEKIDAGASFVITQLFFDNAFYFSFLNDCHRAGIEVPVIPGIMPITNYSQLKTFTEMCGTTIPGEVHRMIEPVQDDTQEVVRIGIDWATGQCRDLLDAGVPGIHFYTLNQSPSTRSICAKLGTTKR